LVPPEPRINAARLAHSRTIGNPRFNSAGKRSNCHVFPSWLDALEHCGGTLRACRKSICLDPPKRPMAKEPPRARWPAAAGTDLSARNGREATGISGQFYCQFAPTIAGATIISLIVSLTLSPAMCALLLKPRHNGQRVSKRGPARTASRRSIRWCRNIRNLKGGREGYQHDGIGHQNPTAQPRPLSDGASARSCRLGGRPGARSPSVHPLSLPHTPPLPRARGCLRCGCAL
jgi:AcrB/AcrD/AcrF family